MKLHTAGLPLFVILVPVAAILLAQSIWLFLDARKRGRKYWFWGVWGLIQFPIPTLTYFITMYLSQRQRPVETPEQGEHDHE
jgi:NADH:ubiquinone oxidoreductase subunit H